MNNDFLNKVLIKTKQDNIKFVNLQFTDIFGIVKSLTIPIKHLNDAFKRGIWFDGSSIAGFTRIQESDMYLIPDPRTYSLIPWLNSNKGNTCRFICDVYNPNRQQFQGDPRFILKKVMNEALKFGFEYNTGPELEFYLFKKDNLKENDNAGYFDLSLDISYNVRREMVLSLEKFGIDVEMDHHEVGPSQHEIDFRYGNALRTADNAITLKFVLKAIAEKYNLYATFMPKPIFGRNGSGMHVHQSLFNIKTKKNLFFDVKNKYKLSKLAYYFLAGQIKHIKAISAVISPTVNSYKRLVPGYEAPVYICWGQINRSALIRIPKYSPGKENSTRLELRCPDPSCNPYLAFAVMLKAGLDGIKNKLEVPPPIEEDVYLFSDEKLDEMGIGRLPYSLLEAIKELKKDDVIKEALGEHTFKEYIRAKLKEWDNYRVQVTDWEMKQYFERY